MFMDDVEFRNGLSEADLVEDGLEYLVTGQFRKGDRDVKMFDATRWVAHAELEALGSEAMEAALDACDAQYARVRRQRTE